MNNSYFEFMNETPLTSLKIYKAKLYKDLGEKDNRMQVRIIPYQKDIPSQEEVNLPKFPSFFSDKVIKGQTETEQGYEKADTVAVLATSDFNYGFIFGPTNLFEGNTNQKQTNSYPFPEVKKYLNQINALPSSFDAENLTVEHWHTFVDENNDEYGLIDLFNWKTGDKVTMITTGVVFVLSRKQIFLRIGTGDTNALGGKQFSSISLKPSECKISTPSFILDADKVKLGNNGLNVLATNGAVIPSSVGGLPLIGIKEILV